MLLSSICLFQNMSDWNHQKRKYVFPEIRWGFQYCGSASLKRIRNCVPNIKRGVLQDDFKGRENAAVIFPPLGEKLNFICYRLFAVNVIVTTWTCVTGCACGGDWARKYIIMISSERHLHCLEKWKTLVRAAQNNWRRKYCFDGLLIKDMKEEF